MTLLNVFWPAADRAHRGIVAVLHRAVSAAAAGLPFHIMSLQALSWAFDQEIFSSSQKFILIALANYASDTGKSYPSVETLSNVTSLHEDTIRSALAALVADAVIVDTGKRAGITQQVKVYQLPEGAFRRPRKTGVFPSLKPRERPEEDPVKTGRRPEEDPKKTPVFREHNREPGTGNHKPTTGNGSACVVESCIPDPVVTPLFEEMRRMVSAAFGRPENERWSCEEEFLLSEICMRRPDCRKELGQIRGLKTHRSEKILTLLKGWGGHMDRVRTANKSKVDFSKGL